MAFSLMPMPHVQAGLVLIGDTGLVQADDTLVLLADTHRQDGARAGFADGDLVAGKDGYAAPGGHHVAIYVDALRVDTEMVAFPAERGDGAGVGENEPRLPPPREQFVEVVGGGWPSAGGDALVEVGIVQQPEAGVVDHFVFLAFPQCLNSQPELLFDLVQFIGSLYRSATRVCTRNTV